MMKLSTRVALLLLLAVTFVPAHAQRLDPLTEWATNLSYTSGLHQNIVYQTTKGIELRLDVLSIGGPPSAKPVVLYLHGGGWVAGNKEGALIRTLPYIARGIDVVNVDYRLGSQALAPGAVEDCRCALRWIQRHAKEYGFDTNKIIVAGESAGGHLALMTGMLTPSDGFDNDCEVPYSDWQLDGPKDIKVAAIIDFFGLTELPEFLQPAPGSTDGVVLPMPRNFALRWFGDSPDRMEMAKKMSPVTYARKGTPPILIVHGDKDPYVPYQQATILREALNRAGVQNELFTIEGGGHGASPPRAWTTEQNLRAHEAVFQFLEKVGVLSKKQN